MGLGAGLWLLVLAAPFYLWGLGAVGFQDPDEGMYAEIAREMLASRDWVVPTFNGVPYIEKPPLMYWLTAGSLALLGPSEFAARLWKVLPMLASVALTGALGGRLFSRRTGIVGAGILGTTLGIFLFSRLAQMDPLLLLSITASAYGIVRAGDAAAERRGAGDLWWWGGVAGGVMSKGLPGLVFPLGLLTLWVLVRQDGGLWRRVWTLRGAGGAALLVLPWHLLAARRVPGFVQFYVIDNQLLRFLGTRAYQEDGRSLGTAAFLGVTACALLPWTPYLAAALGRAVRGEARDPRWRFLLGWIAAVIGFFSVSSFKLEYYALPAFPAIALVVAVLVCQASDGAAAGRPEDGSKTSAGHKALLAWTRISLWGGMLFCLGIAWVWWAGWLTPRPIIRALSFWSTNYRIILDHDLPLPPVTPGPYAGVLLAGGLVWVAAFGAAAWCLARGRVLTSAAAVGSAGLGLSLLAGAVLHEVGPHHSLKPLADHLNAVHRPGDVLIHERGLEKGGGLLFYTRRPVLILDGRRGDLEFGSGLPEAAGRFIDARRFREIWSGEVRVFLVTDLPASQSAISRMSSAVPIPVAATGTRWLYANRSVR